MNDPRNKLAFAVLELLFAAITMAGYLYTAVRIAAASRREGSSMTAASPLGLRWLLHETGQREDDAARRLFLRLPGMSETAAKLILQPTVLASRLSGYTPGILQYPFSAPSSMMTMFNARTTFFDQALADSLEDAEQVVLLGAGWDTRAYGLPESVGVYEVDAPDTQHQKRALLAEADVDPGPVTFVAADFNTESWLDRLGAEGFDPARKTFVLWEGVTYYLQPEAVADTLRAVATLAPGSQVAFDYFSRGWVEGSDAPLFVKMMRPALKLTGEEWEFGISTTPDARAEAARFIEAHGLTLERWAPYGEERKPFGGLVLATVAP